MYKRRRFSLIVLIVILISSPLCTASDLDSVWGEYESFYKFSYLKEYQIYDASEEVIDTAIYKTDYSFWNLTIEDNWLHYRCSEYMKVLAFLKCTTESCYNYTLFTRFNYDRFTETVGIGIALDLDEGLIYTTDANGKPYGNVYEIAIPLNIMQVFFNNYFWFGLFALFLPVESPSFSFITDYSDYAEFPNSFFDCKYETDFKYRGEKINGHYFKIVFEEGEMFDYSVVFENHEMEFKYSDKGILYSFSDSSEIYSNISGNIKLEKTQIWQVFLENEGKTVYETRNNNLPFNLILFSILIAVILRKKRKSNVF
ncbi:MAG: hypothetical protein HGN29_09375 [Asgard group archaeon]|nr:hypothetical protein [Asgard group archaeon]